ncbi:type II toxin-antitoxin system RelE/ParE family toxin [Brenneria goodwinii]|uniref:type II toxin-antitoxin system RelE/ParE family toxin n=1 Tax=Brenneria goodwinii TaxID=1109412 RepID=UPI001F3CCE6C|nr:type II toxin-antitoxin system RelE/ParE family toxin [Brenneria goodwinii]
MVLSTDDYEKFWKGAILKKFAFVNDAAEREYKALPADVQDDFGKDLRRIQFGQDPELPIDFMDSIGIGVIELKINGSPAYRCTYVAKYLDTVVVLHSFKKTTNGVDRQAKEVAEKRLKELMADVREAERCKKR